MTADISARQLAITPSGMASRTVCEAGHQRLTLRLNQDVLSQKLTALLGFKPRGELTFVPAIGADEPYAQGLCQLLQFLAQQLDSTAARLPAAACHELEQAVQIAFLWASQRSFSHLLERLDKEPTPGVVRRLEEFIEAHWQDAITIDRLVAEAGVSARSIFRAFDRNRGYSPMAFVKAIRLRHARALLMSGDPGVSVTATAFKCNFASPGHFARDYRDAFGELPSEPFPEPGGRAFSSEVDTDPRKENASGPIIKASRLQSVGVHHDPWMRRQTIAPTAPAQRMMAAAA